MLEVYITDASGIDPEGAYPLSQYRLEKLKRQKNDSARRLGIAAELLLIKALETAAPEVMPPLDIRCGRDGKPELSDSEIYFNLSHSGKYAACAVSDSPVGLDIQTVRGCNVRLAEKYFTPQERRFIKEGKASAHAFTQLWSIKESCVKLLGTGLKTPLSSFSVDPESGTAQLGGLMLHFYHSVLNGCHLSVCSADSAAVKEINISTIKLLP